MKLILCLLIFLPLTASAEIPAWGRTGHRVVGEVAEQNLSRKARKAVELLLGGESLAKVSTFGDDIKSDPSYKKYSPWHYANFPADSSYTEVSPSRQGDVVRGIERSIAALKDPGSSLEDRVFYLKLLVHLVGDLHQPMHLGRAADRGGNDIQLQWFGRGTNLHRVWDSDMIEDYGMSYTELAQNLPRVSRRERKIIGRGGIRDWVEEIHGITNRVYNSAEPGEKLYYRYSYDWWDTVERQLLRGGLRLAAILNEIYG